MGGIIEDYGDSVRVICNNRPKKANIKTLPYPRFPQLIYNLKWVLS